MIRATEFETTREAESEITRDEFEITESEEKVRYPRRPYVRSGYIVLPKGSSKTNILNKISQKLVLKRTKQSK